MIYGIKILIKKLKFINNFIFNLIFFFLVERTQFRPLACNELNEKQAITFLAGILSASLAILLQLNWLRYFFLNFNYVKKICLNY